MKYNRVLAPIYPYALKLLSFLFNRRTFFYNINAQYVRDLPKSQNAIDIFKGSWSSKLPDADESLVTGEHHLFQDDRIIWAEKQLGGFAGKSILELGPLEAGHSFMLEKFGARKVIAVEGSTQAYLKCLIVKELYGLTRCHFFLGDIVKYLEQARNTFDICLSSGVLYHMTEPVKMLHLLSKVSPKIILWTHYYDEKIIKSNYKLAAIFDSPESQTYNDIRYEAYKYNYRFGLVRKNFCGGANPYSYWLTRESILDSLRKFGYDRINIKSDDISPSGPCFMLIAEKS